MLDEVARLGYMHLLEQARDAGRKFGITLLMLYQSLSQWGQEGKQAWFDGTAWQLFADDNGVRTRSRLALFR